MLKICSHHHVLSKVVVAVASLCNIKLDCGGALEGQGGVVVIIVSAVKVSLESRSLGNLNEDLKKEEIKTSVNWVILRTLLNM